MALRALFLSQTESRWATKRKQWHRCKKPPETPASQRYADSFISPSEFQWESQASTTLESKKGRDIINQHKRGQTIHLFCRYDEDRPFTYCDRCST